MHHRRGQKGNHFEILRSKTGLRTYRGCLPVKQPIHENHFSQLTPRERVHNMLRVWVLLIWVDFVTQNSVSNSSLSADFAKT